MEKLEQNIFANLAGVVWSAILSVLCLPLYIKLMGVEAFGLVGLYITLQSIFVILDMGIGATLCRELARLTSDISKKQEQRNLVFTLQVIYWLIAVFIGLTVFLLAPYIANYWVKPQVISISEVTNCIKLMGISMFLQFPFAFYQSGLLGLQRQLLSNIISSGTTTLRIVGSLLALFLIHASPEIFFITHIIASAAGTIAIALALWRSLTGSTDSKCPRFCYELISRVWRFSAAYAINSVASIGLFQTDKIILSRFLTLELFGYYALAKGIVSGLYALIIAVNSAIFPQFTELIAREAETELTHIYHRGCQLMSVLLMPVGFTIIIFSYEVLFLWTNDAVIAANAHLVLSLLMTGMLLFGLFQPLYYLQVAYGWWKLISGINLMLFPLIIPLYLFLIRNYSAPGGAAGLVILNTIYLCALPLMHRHFLKGRQRNWFLEDICFPMSGVVLIVSAAKLIFPSGMSRLEILIFLSAVALLSFTIALALSSHIRRQFISVFQNYKKRQTV